MLSGENFGAGRTPPPYPPPVIVPEVDASIFARQGPDETYGLRGGHSLRGLRSPLVVLRIFCLKPQPPRTLGCATG